ncbi:MAG: FecR domain-containing protein [Pseudomonadota bacterium]|nr:FecR domain-containing protein [Pseudomonadota bacterium]
MSISISRTSPLYARASAAIGRRPVFLALAAFALAGASPALAACALAPDPDHAGARMLQCGAAVTAHLAEGTIARPVGGNKANPPRALRLSQGAVLIEFQPQPGAETFQILTPEAIAAVRGTNWAVEIERGKTSVFVVNGQVEVQARRSGATATLGAGEGVDVTRSTKALEVKHWPEPRVRKLLARFGR